MALFPHANDLQFQALQRVYSNIADCVKLPKSRSIGVFIKNGLIPYLGSTVRLCTHDTCELSPEILRMADDILEETGASNKDATAESRAIPPLASSLQTITPDKYCIIWIDLWPWVRKERGGNFIYYNGAFRRVTGFNPALSLIYTSDALVFNVAGTNPDLALFFKCFGRRWIGTWRPIHRGHANYEKYIPWIYDTLRDFMIQKRRAYTLS